MGQGTAKRWRDEPRFLFALFGVRPYLRVLCCRLREPLGLVLERGSVRHQPPWQPTGRRIAQNKWSPRCSVGTEMKHFFFSCARMRAPVWLHVFVNPADMPPRERLW